MSVGTTILVDWPSATFSNDLNPSNAKYSALGFASLILLIPSAVAIVKEIKGNSLIVVKKEDK